MYLKKILELFRPILVILIILAVIILLYKILTWLVFADDVSSASLSSISSAVSMEDREDITPTPTPTMTPEPTPAPVIDSEDTIAFYDSVIKSLDALQVGQLKLMISVWAMVGLLVGFKILKNVFG